MNTYYLIYIDKETDEVSSVEVLKTKKGYDEILILIKKNNENDSLKRKIILSKDDLLNKVIEFKNINKMIFYNEIRSITDQLRDIAYDIEGKIDSFSGKD